MGDERVMVSSKVRKEDVQQIKKDGVALSRVIEASLHFWCTLSDEEKKVFLLANTPGLTKSEVLGDAAKALQQRRTGLATGSAAAGAAIGGPVAALLSIPLAMVADSIVSAVNKEQRNSKDK